MCVFHMYTAIRYNVLKRQIASLRLAFFLFPSVVTLCKATHGVAARGVTARGLSRNFLRKSVTDSSPSPGYMYMHMYYMYIASTWPTLYLPLWHVSTLHQSTLARRWRSRIELIFLYYSAVCFTRIVGKWCNTAVHCTVYIYALNFKCIMY